MKSNFLRWNLSDLTKGLLTAAYTAASTGIVDIMKTGSLPDLPALKTIAVMAAAAALGYLFKNLFTNSDGEHFKTEGEAAA